ncbi:helix-turn-helix transcriptional regulator [Streptomyces sp. NPDC002055]|uniref:helix-turn-helix transcriptional regulator n=1 Tax=Streptomyces sp. NPDC002055 TaxID=3154534 RepID=UPI00332A022D
MDLKSHRPSCAKELREQVGNRGEPVGRLAQAIHAHCAVSLLRAQRLARGLTLKEAADGLNNLAEGRADAPRANGDQLGHWETGRHHPRSATLGLLCEFYACTAQDLGFGNAADAVRAPSSTTLVRGNEPLPPYVTRRTSCTTDSLEHQVDSARRSMDRTLAVSTVSATQLDLLDEQVLWSRERYVYTPPASMITVLLGHLSEVEDLAAHRQPAAIQVRLSELTATLATLIADALMKLGQLPRSQAWYATARNAADDSGNTELRARVRAQAAMLPFYYGPLEAAVTLSREARIICRGRPSSTAAFASAAEARALARLGDMAGAETALGCAVAAFE